ncbi:MAG: YqiJ family protein [Maricaulis sp.]|jgi:hypothetical protein|nr:YqiJ family protein [Maricaulis sp.]
MIELLGTVEATPFVIALMLMLAIAALEGVGLIFGIAVSGLVDGLLPDFDIPDIEIEGPEIEVDADLSLHAPDLDVAADIPEGMGPFTYFLSWLSFGKVPALVLLVAFLTVFGLAGLASQSIALGITGLMIPGWMASIPALAVALPGTRYLGRGLGAIMPKEETEAVSTEGFIGKVATIIRGEARRDLPAEAKLKDKHGLTHWILVEPDLDDAAFKAGEEVLVVSQSGSRYRVIENTHQVLSRRK